MPIVHFTDLNDDLLLTSFQFICEDFESFLSISSTCKKLNDLSLHRSIWAVLYINHKLNRTFGPKSLHQTPFLKRCVIRYLKSKKNLESESPRATSYDFYPIDLSTSGIGSDLKLISYRCRLHGRFMFRVTESEETGLVTVACYDMDDSLKLIWEKSGGWVGWETVDIQSCEIVHSQEHVSTGSDEGSKMTVLLQCKDKCWLNFITFRIRYFAPGTSVQMHETKSQIFILEEQNPQLERGYYQHRGKWVFRTMLPIHIINTETSVSYSVDVRIPPEYATAPFARCLVVNDEYIMVVFRGGRSSTCGTRFDIYKVPESKDEANQLPRIWSLHSPLNIGPFSIITNTLCPKADSSALLSISFYAAISYGYRSNTAIGNILNLPPNTTDPPGLITISTLRCQGCLGGSISQHSGWLVDFDYKPNPHFLFSPINAREAGRLEFGEAKNIFFTKDGYATHNLSFDELSGKLYFMTRGSEFESFGLWVVDLA